MAGQKRGFGRERHNAMKMAVAAVSVAAFGAMWYALGQGHPRVADAPADAPGSVAPVATGIPRSAGPTTAPLPTRRARTSRGS